MGIYELFNDGEIYFICCGVTYIISDFIDNVFMLTNESWIEIVPLDNNKVEVFLNNES
jgi:hypothetical protein